ncbi:hypothetical protein CWI38_0207p0030 [Hamiltosporidium tvaerminnensis]|uniref:Uncharacterized protein n=1 Tax=Hamiltosporidium tvaerminnensis TaxID=1176355 RepID=A0A4Q9M1B3_9MICR|nr:hypothetical protein CWI38_0207p0030 [Hamiltosporidium tvaerminnensis]
MNIWTALWLKAYYKPDRFYVFRFILSMFIRLNFVISYRFTYIFERRRNLEIIFYEEIQNSQVYIEKSEDCFDMKIYYAVDSISLSKTNQVFTYRKENFIGFEILNDFLNANTFQNVHGKVECNFDLAYIFKITKDISELPDRMNTHRFDCLFSICRNLKVIKNRNIFKLLEVIIIKTYFCQVKNYIVYKYRKLEKIIKSISFEKIDFYMKKNLISSFLNILMIRHTFYEDNLILLQNTKLFEISSFYDHIPYKNLLINDYMIFGYFEKMLKNQCLFNILEILLSEINIKSLLLDNIKEFETRDNYHSYSIFSMKIFRSIVISNFSGSPHVVLYELSKAIHVNLEIFGLENIIMNAKYFNLILKNHKLKGLILDNISMNGGGIYYLNDYIKLNNTLEFIDFRNPQNNFTWWISFVKSSNIKKILITFNSLQIEENFIKEFCGLNSEVHILLLQINFCFFAMSKGFCKSLRYFKSLQTLKLYNYESNKDIEPYLLKALNNMKDLTVLEIEYSEFGKKFYNFLSANQKIGGLKINNNFSKHEILNLKPFINYKTLNLLFLKSIRISESGLIEIFKLENLKILSLKACTLTAIGNPKSLNFMSKKLSSLCLQGTDLNLLKYVDMLTHLRYLKNLKLIAKELEMYRLAKLNSLCNVTFNKLFYNWGILDSNDLNRIKSFEVLEVLDLCGCKFIEGSLCDLGKDCKFFNSLQKLNLYFVKLTLDDFIYLRNFKNLKNLKLMFYDLRLLQININLFCLKTCHFSLKKIYDKNNGMSILNYLKEESIDGIYD